MYIKKVDKKNQKIEVAIPLNIVKGKARVKERNNQHENGLPFSPRKKKIYENCYIEWQIGYDVLKNDDKKKENSYLKDEIIFRNYDNKEKILYELSEYVYFFYQWGMIQKNDLEQIINRSIDKNKFIDTHSELTIDRSNKIGKKINHLDFYYSQIKYPLLVYNHGIYQIITEITIKEKQAAVGNQPMLYFCIPMDKINDEEGNKLIGRTTETNEQGIFTIDKSSCNIFLKMMDIFSLLSEKHNHDIKKILEAIIEK